MRINLASKVKSFQLFISHQLINVTSLSSISYFINPIFSYALLRFLAQFSSHSASFEFSFFSNQPFSVFSIIKRVLAVIRTRYLGAMRIESSCSIPYSMTPHQRAELQVHAVAAQELKLLNFWQGFRSVKICFTKSLKRL